MAYGRRIALAVTAPVKQRRLAISGLFVVIALALASEAAGLGTSPAAPQGTCTAAQKAARQKALAAYRKRVRRDRAAYFRKHTSRKLRAAFVRRQGARLRSLRRAASCTLVTPRDVTGPAVTFTATPATPTNATSVTFAFTASDQAAGVVSGVRRTECSLDNGPYSTCTSPQAVNAGEGAHTFQVRAIDNALNIGQPAVSGWKVDTTPPTVSLTSSPTGITNSASATFAFTSVDPTSGAVASGVARTECRLDGAAYRSCSSPLTFTVGEGTHTYEVRAIDDASNTGPPNVATWRVDRTPPTVALTSGPAPTTNSASATFAFTAADPLVGGVAAGVTRTECKLDAAAYAPCSSPLTLTVGEGPHTYQVRAVDAAGNVGATASRSWAVGATPPPPSPNEHFAFGDEMTAATRDEIVGDVAYGVQDEAALEGTAITAVSTFASTSPDWLADNECRFRQLLGSCFQDRRQYWAAANAPAAVGGKGGIFLNWAQYGWTFGAGPNQKIIAHELFHVLQDQLDKLADDVGTPVNQVQPSGPTWLKEGAAEVIGYHVAADRLYWSYASALADQITRAKQISTPLQSLETKQTNDITNVYTLYMVAVDHLVNTAPSGLPALASYYSAIGQGMAWRNAFTAAFGLTVDAYYLDFAAYRASL
jgi:hypothetical protein